MAFPTSSAAALILLLILHGGDAQNAPPISEIDLLEFPLNLEYLEAEFFAWGALGRGLDALEPNLTMGGPPPIGARRANLSPLVRDIITQFAFQEFGHLRAIKSRVVGFPRPLLNLGETQFAAIMNNAFGRPLVPMFDPYANDVNFLLASYVIPYVGLTGYVGTAPILQSPNAKRLVAGLLSVESGQDAVIRTLLYQRRQWKVFPYGFTVEEATNRISMLRNGLGRMGWKDEGLRVRRGVGAEGNTNGNVIAADHFSLAFDRTPQEILGILYGSGRADVPGGFYPNGGNGRIARSYI